MFSSFCYGTKIILENAVKRGIRIEEIYPGEIAKLEYQGHVEYLYGHTTTKTPAISKYICGNNKI